MNGIKLYDVIIIGAGPAGVAAANYFSKNQHNLSYVILEARNRIGGRVISTKLNGINVQIGGAWIHKFNQSNVMHQYVKKFNIEQQVYSKRRQEIIIDAESRKQIDQQIIHTVDKFFLENSYKLNKINQNNGIDLSYSEAYRKLYRQALQKADLQTRICILQWLSYVQLYQGSSADKISAKSLNIQIQQHKDFYPKGGYTSLIKKIAEQCKIKVKFNKIVKQISYNNQKVVVSLSILKLEKVKFIPELPKEYQLSIKRLGISLMNKVIVQFEKNFWGSKSQMINIFSKTEQKFTHVFNHSKENLNILCWIVVGDRARQYQQQKDEIILEDFLKILKTTYGEENIKVKSYLITRWGKEEHSFGSYTYFHIDSSVQDCHQLSKPIQQSLWIVGQHCSAEDLGTVDGAFNTGEVAAQEVVKSLKNSLNL